MTSGIPVCCQVLVAMGDIYLYIVSESILPPEPAYSQELGSVSCCVHVACKKPPNSSRISVMERLAISPSAVIPYTQCC